MMQFRMAFLEWNNQEENQTLSETHFVWSALQAVPTGIDTIVSTYWSKATNRLGRLQYSASM